MQAGHQSQNGSARHSDAAGTSTTSVATARPAAASTAGRLKRREPEVRGPGSAASTTHAAHQRSHRRRDLAGLLRCGVRGEVVATPWAWTWPEACRSSTRPQGKHISQADLDETVNILNLRVNGLGVSGAQVQTHGDEPDLGVHPGRHRRPAGAQADRADGAHVLPPGASASPIPRRCRRRLRRTTLRPASRRSPPCSPRRRSRAST